MEQTFFTSLHESLKDQEQINLTVKKTGNEQLTIMLNRNNKLVTMVGTTAEVDTEFMDHFKAVPEVQKLQVTIADAPATDDDDNDEEPEQETKAAAPKKETKKGGKKKTEAAAPPVDPHHEADLKETLVPADNEVEQKQIACKQHLESAQKFFAEGKLKEALDQFQLASEIFPEDEEIKNSVELMLSNIKEAEDKKQAEQELANKQREFKEHLSAGDVLFKERKYEDSLVVYKMAQDLFPDSTVAQELVKKAEKWVKAVAELGND